MKRQTFISILVSLTVISSTGCRTASSSSAEATLASDPPNPVHIGHKIIGNVDEIIRKQLKTTQFVTFAATSGLITRLVAKNLCTCVYVQQLLDPLHATGNSEEDSRRYCRRHTSLYGSNVILKPTYQRSGSQTIVQVEGRFTGSIARLLGKESIVNAAGRAAFDANLSKYGCKLVR